MLNRFSLINLVNESCLNDILNKLKLEGFEIFELDGDKINDAKGFFRLSKDIFPLDPPISGKVNWDAFSDSLWEGIYNLKKQQVAIIWTKVDNILVSGLGVLLQAVQCLTDISTSLYNDSEVESERIRLVIFLVGNGTNFPYM